MRNRSAHEAEQVRERDARKGTTGMKEADVPIRQLSLLGALPSRSGLSAFPLTPVPSKHVYQPGQMIEQVPPCVFNAGVAQASMRKHAAWAISDGASLR